MSVPRRTEKGKYENWHMGDVSAQNVGLGTGLLNYPK